MTWRKHTNVETNTGTPRLGSKGCSLCYDRSIPEYLNAHVNESQTCADIHLQLAMLRYDNAMCAVGQDKYQELCCAKVTELGGKSMLGLVAGVVVAGFFLSKIFTIRKRRVEQKMESGESVELPRTVSLSSRSGSIGSNSVRSTRIGTSSASQSRSSRNGRSASRSRSSRSDTVDQQQEMLSSSWYVKMEDQTAKTPPRSSRHQSRPGEKPIVDYIVNGNRSRNTSRSRGRPESRSWWGRSSSRSRPKDIPETTRSTRDTRPTSTRSSRDVPTTSSRPPSKSRSGQHRSRSRPRDSRPESTRSSRGRPESTRPSRDRPMRSHSRARSSSQVRDRPESTRSSRDRPMRSHSRARSSSQVRDRPESTRSSRDRPMRSHSRARSSSQVRDRPESTRSSRDRPMRSHSRARSRSRPRDTVDTRRQTGSRERSERREDYGPVLPSQVV